jgi:hypothetical protein
MRTLAVATALTAHPLRVAGRRFGGHDALPAPPDRARAGRRHLTVPEGHFAPDPWVPTVPYRELMVSVFYPATSANGPTKQYMTPLESQRNLERENIPGLPLDIMSTVRTNAVVDAKPAGRWHSLPLVVLSPGWTQPRATLTALAEDLASHGYVVAAIDHTYENRATTFPDGHVTDCAACAFDDHEGFWEKFAQVRRRTRRSCSTSCCGTEEVGRPDRPAAHRHDRPLRGRRGHHAGDARRLPHPRRGRHRRQHPRPDPRRPGCRGRSCSWAAWTPTRRAQPGPYDDWETDWTHLTGWKRWLMVSGTVHSSFTDLGVLADQLGVDIGASIDAYRALDDHPELRKGFLRPEPEAAVRSR